MSAKLPPSASVVKRREGTKLHAPAAERNVDALCDLLSEHAAEAGAALELASGTGQHIVAFAKRMPHLVWQPTELDAARLASINAYVADANLATVKPALRLDATEPGWSAVHNDLSLILLVNLLHLITAAEAEKIVNETVAALRPRGRFILYGPFMRAGELTSRGDAQFHAQLAKADSRIGYKNDDTVETWLRQAGAQEVKRVEMPANNLAFVATR